jgi:hypothetical protein
MPFCDLMLLVELLGAEYDRAVLNGRREHAYHVHQTYRRVCALTAETSEHDELREAYIYAGGLAC